MVADSMAFVQNALVNVRVPFYSIANAKKTCFSTMSGKHI
jgi:hypothetical protein